MLSSRLFWKLFLWFMVVNLLTGAALVSATWSWQHDKTQQTRDSLDTTLNALAESWATEWAKSPSDNHARSLQVLAEQAEVAIHIQREANSEELSIQPSSGIAKQASKTRATRANIPLVEGEQRIGNLTITRLNSTDDDSFAELWGRYAYYAPILALLMVAVGYGVVAHLVGPVRALHRSAHEMLKGNYSHRTFVSNRDELGALARSFNEMSEELDNRFSQLEESDRRQATVLGGMIEGVVAIDDSNHVLFANSAAGKLFDFFPSQVVGRPLIEVVRNHALHSAVGAAIDTRTPQRLEIDWDEHVLSVQVTPLVGDPGGAVVVLHDTTELRRLETLRRDFVANVSHELKTPLSTIRANAETLLRGAVDDIEHRTKFLTGIEQQSERLSDLIHDMLNLARIESAQQPFEIAAIPVGEQVASCFHDYRPRAEAKQIDLSVEEPADDNLLVKSDHNGLRVILGNLIDNAIKYTPDGGSVQVGWSTTASVNGPMVKIAVSDTGLGIPEEKLSRVFERFFRVDEARSRELGGTGLGLSIVKHLAKSFGGEVSVENLPEQGARFTVTLPAA